MAQKEFTMQVRVVADNPEVFDTVKKLMQKACQEVYALTLILAGSSQNKADIKLFSDDFIEGQQDIEHAAKDVGDLVASADGTPVVADEEDKVL